jgi:hypothetical protein
MAASHLKPKQSGSQGDTSAQTVGQDWPSWPQLPRPSSLTVHAHATLATALGIDSFAGAVVSTYGGKGRDRREARFS